MFNQTASAHECNDSQFLPVLGMTFPGLPRLSLLIDIMILSISKFSVYVVQCVIRLPLSNDVLILSIFQFSVCVVQWAIRLPYPIYVMILSISQFSLCVA